MQQKQILSGVSSDLVQGGVFILIGKPESGKTTVIIDIIKGKSRFIENFDFFLVISPSRFGDITLQDEFHSETLNYGWLSNRLGTISESVRKLGKKKDGTPYRLLIVFDDIVSNMKKDERNAFLTKLFFNRRWIVDDLVISNMVTTQRYLQLPTFVRSTCTHIFVHHTSKKDVEDIRRENLTISKRQWDEIFEKTIVASVHPKPFIFIHLQPFQLIDQSGRKIFLNIDQQIDFRNRSPLKEETRIFSKIEQPKQNEVKKNLMDYFK